MVSGRAKATTTACVMPIAMPNESTLPCKRHVGEPHDEKVMNREIGRLRMSLQAAEPGLEKLVFLHYPPVYTGTSAPEIVATLKEFGIKTCFYGHLHGNAIRFAVQGEVDGIRYKLVSADGLRFCPYRIN